MSLKVDVRKLDLFNDIAREGSQTVAENLETLAGIEATMDVSKINFLQSSDLDAHIGTDDAVGIFVELIEPPNGYVLFVMEPAASKSLAQAMVGGMDAEESTGGFTDMERSALQEIGNIMTSGYVDGLANVLDTTIDISTPSFAYGPANQVVQKMGGWPDEDIAFVVDSTILSPEADVELTVYTLPHVVELVGLIQAIDLETDVARDTTASEEFVP
ncbi:MAG: chemotaxis protein CheC [Halococcoides sp.]